MEQWKDIQGFEGYQVSDQGRVRSLDRVIIQSNGVSRKWKGTIITPRPQSGGYPILSIYRKSEEGGRIRKVTTVHSLVASEFIPNPENKPTVNHINKDKEDNRVDNLEWNTQGEQSLHANLGKTKKKDKTSGVRSFTDDQVREIRSKNKTGTSQTKLGKEYGVSRRCIGNLINRKTYKNVK